MFKSLYRTLKKRIQIWSIKVEKDLVKQMDKRSEELTSKIEQILLIRDKQIEGLTKHYNQMFQNTSEEFQKSNEQIAERFRKLQIRVERELELLQELTLEARENVEFSRSVISKIRGLIHSRTQVIESIQRATAFLMSDLKILQSLEAQANVVEDRIERTAKKELSQNRSVARRIVYEGTPQYDKSRIA